MKDGKTFGERLSEELVSFCCGCLVLGIFVGLAGFSSKGETGSLAVAILGILIISSLCIMSYAEENKSIFKSKPKSKAKMKKCPSCNRELGYKVKKCPWCGHKF